MSESTEETRRVGSKVMHVIPCQVNKVCFLFSFEHFICT